MSNWREKLKKVQVNGKYGIVDEQGKEVLPCSWAHLTLTDKLSKDRKLRIFAQREILGKWGEIDLAGNEIHPFLWDWFIKVGDYEYLKGPGREERRRMAERYPICRDGKWGYEDGFCKEVIPCKYEDAAQFINGFGYVKEEGVWYRVDESGSAAPLEEKNIAKKSICGDRWAVFQVKESLFHNGYGLLDMEGRILTPPRWFRLESSSRKGVFLASDGVKQIYLDQNGNPAGLSDWDYVQDFREGFAPVRNKDGKWGYANAELAQAFPCVWEEAEAFSEGLAAVRLNGKYGYINTSGELVIPCRWEMPEPFYKEHAWCMDQDGPVLISRSGEEVCRFHARMKMEEDCCAVSCDGKWGYVDARGKQIVPCVWDYAGVSTEGRLPVSVIDKLRRIYLWGFLDHDGKELCRCIFDDVMYFREGMAAVQQGSLWGYIDRDGNLVTGCIFTEASHCCDGKAYARREDQWAEVTLEKGVTWLETPPDNWEHIENTFLGDFIRVWSG